MNINRKNSPPATDFAPVFPGGPVFLFSMLRFTVLRCIFRFCRFMAVSICVPYTVPPPPYGKSGNAWQ